MNKKIKSVICSILLLSFCICITKIDTQAAGGLSISASASQVSEGGTFTVTVKATGNYFVEKIQLSVSGGTVVSNLGVSSLDKGESASAKIKLIGESCVVSVSGNGANYDTLTEGTASASVTVKQKKVVVDTRSKDNTLSSLSVSTGTLSPSFSASTTEYQISLSGTTEKVTLSATANDAKATVSGTGEKPVAPGSNRFVIVCTAENGSKKEYVVNIYVDETPVIHTNYGEMELGVVRNQVDIGIPATFESTSISLEGQSVQAYHSNQYNLTLVYMVNESNEKNFYIYDNEKGITSVFKPVSVLGRNVVIFDLTEEERKRDHMVYSEVTIDGITMYGWTYENPDYANYAQILVMNEFGEKVVYQYEKTENSLQLYKEYVEDKAEDEVTEPTEQALFPNEYYMYAIAGLGALSLILFIAMIYFIASRRSRYERRKRKAVKRLEMQKAKQQAKQQGCD